MEQLRDLTDHKLEHIKCREIARYVGCLVDAQTTFESPGAVMARKFPGAMYLKHFQQKAAVVAGTGAASNWAEHLLPSELGRTYVARERSYSVVGRLLPLLVRVPFQTRVPSETEMMTASGWVGHVGAAKVVVRGTIASHSLAPLANAAIFIVTDELARSMGEAGQVFLTNAVAKATANSIDSSFVNPAQAAVAGLAPASITNGLTPIASSGPTAANAIEDLQTVVADYVASGGRLESAVVLLSSTNAVSLALSGNEAFRNLRRDGGLLGGMPAFASDAIGSNLILLDTRRVLIADDEEVSITLATDASVEMSDSPTSHAGTATAASGLVSLFQTNCAAIRASRIINWQVLSDAAVYVNNAEYVDTGSPA